MNLSWIRLSILFLALNVSTYSVYAANSCRSLFEGDNSAPQIETQTPNRRSTSFDLDRRNLDNTLVILKKPGKIISQFTSSLVRPDVNLQIANSNGEFFLRTEKKVQVGLEQRLKVEDLPLDLENLDSKKNTPSDFVINAGLESGRKFLNDTLSHLGAKALATGKQQAILLFIDVNNLGWINSHFHGHKVTGDLYINAVTKAIKKVVKSNGLIFRQGGDEFAIVHKALSPQKFQTIMTELREQVKIEAHSIFRAESIRRARLLKTAKAKHDSGQISDQQYQAAINDYRQYTAYSQEGLSMGAEYVDVTNVSDLFQAAENRALDMKLAVKKAHHQDTKKYTGESVSYIGAPSLAYKYEFSLISSKLVIDDNTASSTFLEAPKDNESKIPIIKVRRNHVLNRLKGASLVKLIDETGQTSVYAEYYQSGKFDSFQKIEMNFNTGLPDLRDLKVQKLVKFLGEKNSKSQFVWVNLLNLGKLNYFKSGTQTGDHALAVISNILKTRFRSKELILKGFGSEFLVMINPTTKTTDILENVRDRIEEALQNSPELNAIYLNQKSVLQTELLNEQNPQKKAELTAAITEIENLLSQPLVGLKTAEVQNGSYDINSILDLLKY